MNDKFDGSNTSTYSKYVPETYAGFKVFMVILVIAIVLLAVFFVDYSNSKAMSCYSCDVWEVDGDGTARSATEKGTLNPNLHVWSVTHTDGSAVVPTCTVVTIVINEYHDYTVCQ